MCNIKYYFDLFFLYLTFILPRIILSTQIVFENQSIHHVCMHIKFYFKTVLIVDGINIVT